ncbi:hypothetical protein HZS61_003084 [Fusarium oxysporum f. sp. conglutinans]|uniref:Heterokaryon incompatibility domain-containing protein n=3 Tax=Fusarium oxysporum TaxID=5507 RepID=A0A8H6GG99_FUSOX|nr:hypothetical protein FOXB_02563 [Fusarium oxysporum f. sp. conglutinans Fo5176]KAF6517523.1 hypothetical protein HZS61_003084 [Fusarium oxysporum f. sp. conglutinans]KAI8404302.1 hypothetical protein FOFC_15797 [Fusarium oxysporum]
MSISTRLSSNHQPRVNQSHLEAWPRRLLDVASMTSYERKPGNKYNGIKEPPYNAVSYTWGRFEDRREAPIRIKGVTWKIPGIAKHHFTVNEFHQVLKTVAGSCHFVWVDVACIDQENDAVKMDEINHQAAIYQRAKEVYAWLTPWTTTEMHKAFHILEGFAIQFAEAKLPDGNPRLLPFSSSVAIDLNAVHATLRAMKQHGWFTSLWTLQEAFLSRPFFLSKTAEACHYQACYQGQFFGGKFPVGVSFIAGHCRSIWETLRSDNSPQAVSICQDITDSGLLGMNFFKEPYLLYPAALRRYVSLPQDAVYAIMHVFGIRLPSVDDATQLLLRLAIYINQRDPVSYQIFLHEKWVNPLDAWRMSTKTHLPYQFFRSAITKSFCTIESYRGFRPEFAGRSTTLEDIWRYWTGVQQDRRNSRKIPYQPTVFLDASIASNCMSLELCDDPPAPEDPDIGRLDDTYTEKMRLQDLASVFPHPMESYRVLLLGSKEFASYKQQSPVVCQLEYHIGLIVRQEAAGEQEPWCRVGFCSWVKWSRKDPSLGTIGTPDRISTPYRSWPEIKCRIG